MHLMNYRTNEYTSQTSVKLSRTLTKRVLFLNFQAQSDAKLCRTCRYSNFLNILFAGCAAFLLLILSGLGGRRLPGQALGLVILFGHSVQSYRTLFGGLQQNWNAHFIQWFYLYRAFYVVIPVVPHSLYRGFSCTAVPVVKQEFQFYRTFYISV